MPRLLTRPLAFAAVANAMLTLAGSLFVHLPGFLQQLGAGEAQIGRIMGVQALGAIAAWPLVGRAMDAIGRRTVVLAGVSLYLVVVGLYLSIGSLGPGVYGVRVLDGAAVMMWYTALFTYAADLVPAARRTEGLAVFGVSGLIPMGLGAQAGDLILATSGYHELFGVALAFAIVGLLVCIPLQDVRHLEGDYDIQPRSIFATAGQANLLPVWVAAFTFFTGVVALLAFLKTFVVTTGLGSVGGFYLAYAAVAVTLRVFLGWLPDRLGARRMIGLAMPSYAAGLAILSIAGTSGHVILAGILCGAGHGYTFPVLLSLVVARAHPRRRGAATAFFTALDWVALLVAGPAIGYGIEAAGYGRAFFGLALLFGFGTAAFYRLDRRETPASP